MRHLLVVILAGIFIFSCSHTSEVTNENNYLISELENIVDKTEYIYVENYNKEVFQSDNNENTLEIVLYNGDTFVDGIGQVLYLNPLDLESLDKWILEAATMRFTSNEIFKSNIFD